MHKASDLPHGDDRLLTSKEVSERIGIKPGTLRQWRSKNRGPRYLKQPGPSQAPVRYRASDVEAWKAQRTRAADPATWPVTETTP
jgi:predicted DNA-binding transcriptional regulator AlpA